MQESEIIEKVEFFLNRMCKGSGFEDIGDQYIQLFDPQENRGDEYIIVMDRLEAERLADRIGNTGTRMKVTDFGRQVHNRGGFKLFLIEKQKGLQEEEERRLLEFQRMKQELHLNSWYLKTRWWPHVFSIIAVVISILALIFN